MSVILAWPQNVAKQSEPGVLALSTGYNGRPAGYLPHSYAHEVVAEIYAPLVERLVRRNGTTRMAGRRDLRTGDASDRVDLIAAREGYRLGPGVTPADVLAQTDELLRSEGIDSNWPGLGEPPEDAAPAAAA
jgi:hypothetical protein